MSVQFCCSSSQFIPFWKMKMLCLKDMWSRLKGVFWTNLRRSSPRPRSLAGRRPPAQPQVAAPRHEHSSLKASNCFQNIPECCRKGFCFLTLTTNIIIRTLEETTQRIAKKINDTVYCSRSSFRQPVHVNVDCSRKYFSWATARCWVWNMRSKGTRWPSDTIRLDQVAGWTPFSPASSCTDHALGSAATTNRWTYKGTAGANWSLLSCHTTPVFIPYTLASLGLPKIDIHWYTGIYAAYACIGTESAPLPRNMSWVVCNFECSMVRPFRRQGRAMYWFRPLHCQGSRIREEDDTPASDISEATSLVCVAEAL